MSQGTIADAISGGITVNSLPAPAGVTNAYVPPVGFTVSGTLNFYGNNCGVTRFDPQQLNAYTSEMLCLAATLAPNGTWNTGSVCNLAAAFQSWVAGFSGGSVSLAVAADYPGSVASNITAATPAYVGAAISAAVGAGIVVAVAANYPSQIGNNSKVTTPAFVAAAIAGGLAPVSSYPSSSNILSTTPAFVNAAIAAATSAIEAYVAEELPGIAHVSAFPSTSDTTSATPAYISAAIVNYAEYYSPHPAIGAAYPSEQDDDVYYTTPLYVKHATAAAITTAEGVAETVAEAAAASAASSAISSALSSLLKGSSAYPDASDNTHAATPGYVAAAIATVGGGVTLTVAADYPADDASDTTAATPAYVAAAVAGVGGGGGLYDISAGVPALSSMTAVNISGTNVVTEASGKAINLYAAAPVTGLSGYTLPAPGTTPYRVRLLFQLDSSDASHDLVVGWSDGTKIEALWVRDYANDFHWYVYDWTTYLATDASLTSGALSTGSTNIWIGLRNDGTDVYFEISSDGVNFMTLGTVTISTSYLADYSKIFWGHVCGAQEAQMTLRCYDVNGLTATFP